MEKKSSGEAFVNVSVFQYQAPDIGSPHRKLRIRVTGPNRLWRLVGVEGLSPDQPEETRQSDTNLHMFSQTK